MIHHFYFRQLDDKYLITNDMGRYMFVSQSELEQLVHDEVNLDSDFGKEAVDNLFCYDGSVLSFVDELKYSYREAKRYLFAATSLHIFVLTNSCNLNCVYCQAHASERSANKTMTFETAEKAVNIALSSPEKELSFEFQGGEPLTAFEVIRHIVEYSRPLAESKNKHISYNLVSNVTLLNEEMADYLEDNNINVSVSVDGDCSLHNFNRPFANGSGSYQGLEKGLKILADHGLEYGAIETTTKFSLSKAKKIIDSYLEHGLSNIFLRNLTPLGCAKTNWDVIGYTPEEYVKFYKDCLDYIIQLNKKGSFIRENYASLLLSKILSGYGINYMELRSPCGAAVGQIAYNYDGIIYTCDEGRMLAEMGDYSFKLGTVNDTYDELLNSSVCKAVCISSVLESTPECCDCVYSPYCGKCPVVNYAMNNNIYTNTSNDYKCKINRGILDLIFRYLQDDSTRLIFESWL